jgi:hypothetical protein
LQALLICRSRTAQTSERQLSSPGNLPISFVLPLHLAERSLEQIGRSPALAVPERVAEVDDERVEIVGEASRGGGEAGTLEL